MHRTADEPPFFSLAFETGHCALSSVVRVASLAHALRALSAHLLSIHLSLRALSARTCLRTFLAHASYLRIVRVSSRILVRTFHIITPTVMGERVGPADLRNAMLHQDTVRDDTMGAAGEDG